jgi:ABC-type transport system involved in cytochrome bd biosynthesis fused ATPase/permease subunit
MNTFARWTAFTLAIAVTAVAGSCLLLVMSRLYGELQSPAFIFGALVAFCACVTLAAIAYAAKLEEDQAAIEEAEAARLKDLMGSEGEPES